MSGVTVVMSGVTVHLESLPLTIQAFPEDVALFVYNCTPNLCHSTLAILYMLWCVALAIQLLSMLWGLGIGIQRGVMFMMQLLGIDMFDKEVDIDGEKIKMYIW